MIYINEQTEEVMVPRVSTVEPDRIVFTNQLTHEEYTYPIVDDEGTTTHYLFRMPFPIFEVGMYDYKIYDSENNVLAIGMAQYGDYIPDTKHYTNETKIIQYNA